MCRPSLLRVTKLSDPITRSASSGRGLRVMTTMWRTKMAGTASPGHFTEIFERPRLLLHLDHAAPDAVPGRAGRLALQVVFLGVDDHGLADHVVLAPAEGDVVHREVHLRDALAVGLKVAEVTGVDRLARRRAAVRVLLGVVMSPGAREVGGAEVTLLVDVDGVLRVRLQAGDLAGNVHLLAHLMELDLALRLPVGGLRGGSLGGRDVGDGGFVIAALCGGGISLSAAVRLTADDERDSGERHEEREDELHGFPPREW